jgi:hypothetical protein
MTRTKRDALAVDILFALDAETLEQLGERHVTYLMRQPFPRQAIRDRQERSTVPEAYAKLLSTYNELLVAM